MAATASTSAPQFAVLLRRSKFASHDPRIAQVYSTFGGDAHRGNYGLKRPIAHRKRHAHITVSAVDSRESQTVWKNAEQSSRWIRMWDEIGISVKPHPASPWHDNLGHTGELTWMVDSEFGAQAKSPPRSARSQDTALSESPVDPIQAEVEAVGLFTPLTDTPNIHAMSDKEFESYLEKLRKMRPDFKRYLKAGELLNNSKSAPRTIWEFSQSYQGLHRRFLGSQTQLEYSAPDSRAIQQRPHLNGGMTYTFTSAMQDMYTRKPQPGRALASTYSASYASFAGMVATSDPHGADRMDWNRLATTGLRDPSRGVSLFSLINAELMIPPNVVGPNPTDLKGTNLVKRVARRKESGYPSRNPYQPGSREYIAHREEPISAKSSPLYPTSKASHPKSRPEMTPAYQVQMLKTLEKLT